MIHRSLHSVYITYRQNNAKRWLIERAANNGRGRNLQIVSLTAGMSFRRPMSKKRPEARLRGLFYEMHRYYTTLCQAPVTSDCTFTRKPIHFTTLLPTALRSLNHPGARLNTNKISRLLINIFFFFPTHQSLLVRKLNAV